MNYENKLMSLANDFNTMLSILKITTHFILITDYSNGHKIYAASCVPRKIPNFT